ncbi:uncharacterized protein [Musca autumnalis]|uniref:uncharacterized protein n=1 Tax=Musca autumnalis TaxID=221902 RepID=UPI003CEDAF83
MSDNEYDSNRRKRSSLVWQYFEKLSNSRVKCRICQHEQRYMGNTANSLRHLKVKHDIDARACGLNDPENVRKMKELSVSTLELEQSIAAKKGHFVENDCSNSFGNNVNEDEQPQMKERVLFHNHESRKKVDPYNSDSELPVDPEYFEELTTKDNQEHEPTKNNPISGTTKRRLYLEEQRIIAETNYFREKADYFRIQKHLAFLQAKKIKYELDLLYGK